MRLPLVLEPALLEAPFQRYVQTAATDRGWLWCHVRKLKVPTGGGRKFITPADPGFPDLILVHPDWPRLLVLELKSAGNKPTPKQRRWLKLLDRIDGIDAAYVIPADWPTILEWLDAPLRRAERRRAASTGG